MNYQEELHKIPTWKKRIKEKYITTPEIAEHQIKYSFMEITSEMQSEIDDLRAYSCKAVDSNVEANRQTLLDRSNVGIAKYGVTTDKANLPLREWLNHALEETLDNANYLRAAITKIDATAENALQELADQAQELNMGYGDAPKKQEIIAWLRKKNGFQSALTNAEKLYPEEHAIAQIYADEHNIPLYFHPHY